MLTYDPAMGDDEVENGQRWRKRGSERVGTVEGYVGSGPMRQIVPLTYVEPPTNVPEGSPTPRTERVDLDDLLANYELLDD